MGKAKPGGQGPSVGGRVGVGRAGEPSQGREQAVGAGGGASDTQGQAQWLGWRRHRSCGMTLTWSQPAATATGSSGGVEVGRGTDESKCAGE